MISGWGQSPGEENNNPLQCSCPGNPTDRGAWWLRPTEAQESDTTERKCAPFCPLFPPRVNLLVSFAFFYALPSCPQVCIALRHMRTPKKIIISVYLCHQLGEGNGSPLQYSSLENPVERRAWWAAVHGVAQSRTRLKQLSTHACIWEGNGNPLQCSCLENPRDGGAWWAAVYQVKHNRTQLKRLSSSSMPSTVILTAYPGNLAFEILWTLLSTLIKSILV